MKHPYACALVCLALNLSAADLVRIPAVSRQVTDTFTGVPVTVEVGEFLIAPYETTQAEFTAVMGYNPSLYPGPRRPVENVSWWEAIRYCNLRSLQEGLSPCYDLNTGECDRTRDGYRLPTAAEWETAAGALSAPKPEAAASMANLGTRDTKDPALLLEAIRAKGTREAGSHAPNEFGLYDMLGNVWEWCQDWFNPAAGNVQPARDPAGPARGLARIIRGGSFISTLSGWGRGYHSSMEPGYKSRFTGFRVCRSLPARPAAAADDPAWFEPYNRVPAGFENATGGLAPLLSEGETAAGWENRKPALRAKWAGLLGAPSVTPPPPAVRLAETVFEQNYTGRLMYLQVEPDWWEKIYLMTPPQARPRPVPVVIVPYYDVDVPAGKNLGGRSFMPASVRSFAYLAVQQGYMAVAIRWFGESYGERYDEAVANLKLKYPECSGLGKWVWDARRLIDYLYTLPEVDRARIGIIGHSLGAKMALYAAAMDERIAAAVFSEGGIGFSFSNYDDFWYLGGSLGKLDKAADQHELLALTAPRPFLLIGGDEYDGDRSWHYINAARPVYALYGKPLQIGFFNHRAGHTPTPEAVWRSIEWLKRFLGPAR